METASMSRIIIIIAPLDKYQLSSKLQDSPSNLRDYAVEEDVTLDDMLITSSGKLGFESETTELIVTLLSGGGIAAIASIIQAFISKNREIKMTYDDGKRKISFEGNNMEQFEKFLITIRATYDSHSPKNRKK